MRTESIALVLVLVACAPVVVPPATQFDSAVDAPRSDIGPVLVIDMGLHDAGTDTAVDAPGFDAGPVPDSGVLPQAIVVDGMFGEPIWSANPTNLALTNSLMTVAPFDGDA